MKKTLLVAALAAVLVFAFATSALAVGPFFLSGTGAATQNANYTGYLSWNYIKGLDGANNVGTPHGAYTTTTNKCAVCHAVHRAKAGGSVLTAIPAAPEYNLNTTRRGAVAPYLTGALSSREATTAGALAPNGYTKGCAWCHNIGGFATTVAMDAGGGIQPHSNCNRCHSPSPHGTDVSAFPVLAARLINEQPDLAIEADIASGNNGLTEDMFDLTVPAKVQTGLTLGTGYLCNGCHTHGSGTDDLAFAVNVPGAAPSISGEGATSASANTNTGHRVTAVATTTWNLGVSPNGATFDAALPWKYNAYYTGQGFKTGSGSAAPGGVSQIAWASSNTCQTCHDQKLANGDSAFPHGYVNGAGNYSGNVDGASYIWMTTAANAAGTTSHTGLAKNSALANQGNMLLSEDGLCLKCHVKDAQTVPNVTLPSAGAEGVGISF